jgi:CTP:molybdopterin cytidylyltransferase MocA
VKAAYVEGFGAADGIRYGDLIMSGMTVSELAEAADWINAQHAVRPLTVSLAPVMRFADAARAHSIVENGQLPHLSDHTIGRITLQP